MALVRGSDGFDPVRPERVGRVAGGDEERRVAPAGQLGSGTLACPLCDAPVALPRPRVSPADALHCPFCRHGAPVREFLSLAPPVRPARVTVRVSLPAHGPAARM